MRFAQLSILSHIDVTCTCESKEPREYKTHGIAKQQLVPHPRYFSHVTLIDQVEPFRMWLQGGAWCCNDGTWYDTEWGWGRWGAGQYQGEVIDGVSTHVACTTIHPTLLAHAQSPIVHMHTLK